VSPVGAAFFDVDRTLIAGSSAYPVAVNPDAALARVARAEGWEVVRFETLGQRIKLGGAVVTAAPAGGLGGALVRRRAPARRMTALSRR
jgi:hypothetical protein